MSSPAAAPRASATSWTFVVVAFVVSAAVGAVVIALGVEGRLGGGIVGGESGPGATGGGPASYTGCEGRGGAGPFTFSLVAGEGGSFSFNGSSPGPCFAVQAGSNVTMEFSVAPDAGVNHSWVLTNSSAPLDSLPVFPGAGPSNATRLSGFPPGTHVTFTFVATTVGDYRYLCEVSGHEAAGMYGSFYVVAHAPTAGSPTPSSGPRAEAAAPRSGA